MRHQLNLPYEMIYQLAPHRGKDDGKFELKVGTGDEAQQYDRDVNVWIVPKTNPDSWMPTRPPKSLKARSTASQDCFGLARKWLKHCLSKHETCALREEKVSNLPSRLLQIQRSGTAFSVRLAARTEYQCTGLEYLTLSHCWGTGSKTVLTTANTAVFRECIQLDILPKTFIDAIQITAELGYRYLWIDSLCIIQDSREDWEYESTIMADIYRHCVCMISALAASSDKQGCFAPRPPLGFMAFEFQDGDETLHVSEPRWNEYPISWFTDNRTFRAPLDKRAWTLQESVLAPRTLKYGSEFLLWECLEEQASEMEPTMSWIARDFTDLPYKSLLQQAMNDYGPNREGVVSRAWARISMDFSRRSITYSKDRWVALSGVARKLAQECQVQFVAGLPVADFIRHVLWTSIEPGNRLNNYAPSWSWLSVDSRASQNYRLTTVQMRQLGLPTKQAGLERGWMIDDVTGSTKPDSVLQPVFPIVLEAPACSFTWDIDAGGKLNVTSDGKPKLIAENNKLILDSRVLLDVDDKDPLNYPVIGLQHSYERVTGGGTVYWNVHVVLVRKVSEDPLLWRRIGVGQIEVQKSSQEYVMGLEDFGEEQIFTLI